MKNFATIINFEEKQRISAKTKKTRTLASSRFEAVRNMLSSAANSNTLL